MIVIIEFGLDDPAFIDLITGHGDWEKAQQWEKIGACVAACMRLTKCRTNAFAKSSLSSASRVLCGTRVARPRFLE